MKILNQHLKTIIEISCNSDTKQKLLQWEKDIKHYVQDSCHKTPSILADVENIASALYDFFWPATPPFDAKNLVEYATNYVNETINGNKTISINDYFSKLIKPWTTK
jgi:hypothetical protein